MISRPETKLRLAPESCPGVGAGLPLRERSRRGAADHRRPGRASPEMSCGRRRVLGLKNRVGVPPPAYLRCRSARSGEAGNCLIRSAPCSTAERCLLSGFRCARRSPSCSTEQHWSPATAATVAAASKPLPRSPVQEPLPATAAGDANWFCCLFWPWPQLLPQRFFLLSGLSFLSGLSRGPYLPPAPAR